jgi:hypothetical protein
VVGVIDERLLSSEIGVMLRHGSVWLPRRGARKRGLKTLSARTPTARLPGDRRRGIRVVAMPLSSDDRAGDVMSRPGWPGNRHAGHAVGAADTAQRRRPGMLAEGCGGRHHLARTPGRDR